MNTAMRKKISRYLKSHKIRMIICALFAVSLFITPALTQAQYSWTLNGYTSLQAKEFYFSSNYLLPEGYEYTSAVWNGSDSPMQTIEIQNYENALLCNKTGEDLYYKFSWSIEAYDPDGNKLDAGYVIDSQSGSALASTYAIEKVEKNVVQDISHESSAAETFTGSSCTGSLIGNGSPQKDTYSFTIVKPRLNDGNETEKGTEWTAPEGSYIIVHLSAYNTKDKDSDTASDSYYRNLTCDFKYTVTSTEGFVKLFDVQETNNSKDIILNIGTGTVPDMDAKSQTIYIWWRKDRIEVNPVSTLFAAMYSSYKSSETCTVKDNGGNDVTYTYCQLTVTGLASMSERYLKMYKLTDTTSSAPFNNRSSSWFGTEEAKSTLIAINKRPAEGIANGSIIGYYILSDE